MNSGNPEQTARVISNRTSREVAQRVNVDAESRSIRVLCILRLGRGLGQGPEACVSRGAVR